MHILCDVLNQVDPHTEEEETRQRNKVQKNKHFNPVDRQRSKNRGRHEHEEYKELLKIYKRILEKYNTVKTH